MCAVVIGGKGRRGDGGGGGVNWENPSPPMVLSLSSDGCVKAWDVIQVRTHNVNLYLQQVSHRKSLFTGSQPYVVGIDKTLC